MMHVLIKYPLKMDRLEKFRSILFNGCFLRNGEFPVKAHRYIFEKNHEKDFRFLSIDWPYHPSRIRPVPTADNSSQSIGQATPAFAFPRTEKGQ